MDSVICNLWENDASLLKENVPTFIKTCLIFAFPFWDHTWWFKHVGFNSWIPALNLTWETYMAFCPDLHLAWPQVMWAFRKWCSRWKICLFFSVIFPFKSVKIRKPLKTTNEYPINECSLVYSFFKNMPINY